MVLLSFYITNNVAPYLGGVSRWSCQYASERSGHVTHVSSVLARHVRADIG